MIRYWGLAPCYSGGSAAGSHRASHRGRRRASPARGPADNRLVYLRCNLLVSPQLNHLLSRLLLPLLLPDRLFLGLVKGEMRAEPKVRWTVSAMLRRRKTGAARTGASERSRRAAASAGVENPLLASGVGHDEG